MPNLNALSIDPTSTRGKILSKVNPDDFAWALPIMRTGYAGRGLVYLVVAGLSLWSLFQGGQAQGTKEAFQSMSDSAWGTFIIGAIVAGMVAYAIWRLIDCIWDLEAYGTSGKGIIARAGMLVTGLTHLGIGVLAATAMGALSSSSSGSSGKSILTRILEWPGGQWIVGIAGVLTVCAAIYYLFKAYAQTYRDTLAANHFTTHWNWLLRLGVAAQGFIVGFIGVLLVYAALQSDASEVGGLGTLFDWLNSQAFGKILVVALCLGLLAFALFCFVNAFYRVVPKAAGDDVETVSARLRRQ
ncbi:DUF1206 domain-containing protein [Thalassorhabdomicrobium marinisediminis]|uniref:DUF1206 domain-containing protein n=1 Tax=Thalassorhabdomicrobium marinisediminis TaxID=2170577 RepID=UPI001F53FDB2|nr:DUF1206 domain-containing protein [Thalassorhabdomicrobium marinisediminis]